MPSQPEVGFLTFDHFGGMESDVSCCYGLTTGLFGRSFEPVAHCGGDIGMEAHCFIVMDHPASLCSIILCPDSKFDMLVVRR